MQISSLGDKQFENPQTGNLNKIMKDCVLVKECLRDLNKPTTEEADGQVNAQPEKKKKGFVCKLHVCTSLSSILGIFDCTLLHIIRQLAARGSDQLESLSSFGHCAHFTFHVYVMKCCLYVTFVMYCNFLL